MGIASLVLGIIAFIIAVTFVLAPLGAILAVVGLILGIVDTVKKGKAGQKKVISIVGLIICAIMFVILIVESLFVGLGFLVYNEVSNVDTNKVLNSLEESEKTLFNDRYESYEGTNRGSSVRSLLSSIVNNNALNESYKKITVYYNGFERDAKLLRNEIVSSNSYKVRLSKNSDGYVYKVYITSESTNNNINTNTGINTNNNINTNTNTNANTNVNTTTTTSTGKTSSKTSPLSVGEWGIASKYISGSYNNVPVKVTNIKRGNVAAKEVETYCNRESSIYKYSDAKEGMEWAVIEYDVDLTSYNNSTSIKLDSKIYGTGNNTSIKYNNKTYIVSTVNMTSDYASSKVASAKFAVQLPIGCSDYIIALGSSSNTQAFFKGK